MEHRGNDPFRNPDMVSRGPASEPGGFAVAAAIQGWSPGSTPSGAALSARGEGTSLAARWRDTGDTPTPRVQVLPEKSFGLGSAPPSPELPTSLAASIQDSDFLRLFHASFLSSH